MSDPELEEARSSQRKARAYQGAFEAVFAILIAAGIGYWVDGRFDTAPRGLLTGVLIGFASFVLRLVRLGRQLSPDSTGQSGDGDRGGDERR